MDIEYTITFYSYWHPGGKDGANPQIDNAVLKNKNDLPYIGGRTIKGLIKDGARFINKHQPDLIGENFINRFFGEEDSDYDNENSANLKDRFTSATMKEKINPKYAQMLYHIKERTALDDEKQTINHALRTSEVVVPIELTGMIKNVNEVDEKKLELAMKAVKKLGEKRFRGLGRCKFEINSKQKSNV